MASARERLLAWVEMNLVNPPKYTDQVVRARASVRRLLRTHERELLSAAAERFHQACLKHGPLDSRHSSHAAIIESAILSSRKAVRRG